MSDLDRVDPSRWPTSEALPNLQIPNRGPGNRKFRRTSADGKTWWCMSCDTLLSAKVMQCDEHRRERDLLRQRGLLPPEGTVDGFTQIMRESDELLNLLGQATVQFQRLQLGMTPRPNSDEFRAWRNRHMQLLDRFMLKSKKLKILIDEHLKPLARE